MLSREVPLLHKKLNQTRLKIVHQVKISATVNSIGSGAFENRSQLVLIEIPPSITEVSSRTFKKKKNAVLKQIKIPPFATDIKSGALEGCSSLTQVFIPQSVEHIEFNAFNECF